MGVVGCGVMGASGGKKNIFYSKQSHKIEWNLNQPFLSKRSPTLELNLRRNKGTRSPHIFQVFKKVYWKSERKEEPSVRHNSSILNFWRFIGNWMALLNWTLVGPGSAVTPTWSHYATHNFLKWFFHSISRNCNGHSTNKHSVHMWHGRNLSWS